MTGGHPLALPPVNHTAPVPRRIRAVLDGHMVVDTTSALYLWEWSHYLQYYRPVDDIDHAMLLDEQNEQKLSRGTARPYALQVGGLVRPTALLIDGDDATVEGLGAFSLGGELWSLPGVVDHGAPIPGCKLTAHFETNRVGDRTHSHCTSFEERP